MQVSNQNTPRESLDLEARPLARGVTAEENRVGRRSHGGLPMGSRSRLACTCLSRPGSTRCARHGYMVPSNDKLMKRSQGSKEILRRALTPPNRRLNLRWLNFKPTPSRLSNMSMA